MTFDGMGQTIALNGTQVILF